MQTFGLFCPELFLIFSRLFVLFFVGVGSYPSLFFPKIRDFKNFWLHNFSSQKTDISSRVVKEPLLTGRFPKKLYPYTKNKHILMHYGFIRYSSPQSKRVS